MENTIENKARFFGLYHRQHCLITWERPAIVGDFPILPTDWLELKSLSDISDEDAIEVARICWFSKGEYSQIEFGKLIVFDLKIGSIINTLNNRYRDSSRDLSDFLGAKDTLELYDFLRFKGYAVQYLDMTVEQQIEYGWVQLKTN